MAIARSALFITLFVLSQLLSFAIAIQPFTIEWSAGKFGPDGPWQAVEVNVGSPPQKIALYPGGVFQSHLLTLDVCKNTTISPICYATAAGIYDPGSSTTALDDIIQFPASVDFTEGALAIEGETGISGLDQIDIGQGVIIPNVTLDLHNDIAAIYPDGSPYPIEIGTLALGFTGTVNQSFGGDNGLSINSTLIPGYLNTESVSVNQRTPSNSFGLHIGSVTPKVPGSLHFGGYDQRRIVGDITTQNGHPDTIDLIDISLVVHAGASPWSNSAPLTGLLRSGNATMGPALPVKILPQAPYLNLPASSCSAIAALLPVIYSKKYGLYLWDTASPSYGRIVSSATSLSFTFRRDTLNTANITIHVPFPLLNLTLSAPLVTSPTPYFPCNAESRGHYSLGRAFLQAAFFGVNWQATSQSAVWWLAQAAGPGIITQNNVQNIEIGDTVIKASANDWKQSWDGFWTPLTTKAVVSPINPSTVPTTSSLSQPSATSDISEAPLDEKPQAATLSTGAKVGIAVGSTLVFAIIVGLAIFFFLRRRKARRVKGANRSVPQGMLGTEQQVQRRISNPRNVYSQAGFGPTEVGDGAYYHHELDGNMRSGASQSFVYELPSGRYSKDNLYKH
ncbi:hypothetical protein V498_08085 [Pseudogymnoascus sp. VKM F-4517 (FW-2822)]|nr:hypothetical protein V498_08085 [Pseudogymnoascus sp. VKM F-4517 (FW-2822)]